MYSCQFSIKLTRKRKSLIVQGDFGKIVTSKGMSDYIYHKYVKEEYIMNTSIYYLLSKIPVPSRTALPPRQGRGMLLWMLLSLVLIAVCPCALEAADILILDSTVKSPAISSIEYLALLGLGYTAGDIDIVSNATWAGMTASAFGSYKAIILGDPLCSSGTGAVATLTANANVWGPEITGNVVILGTDPSVHPLGGTPLTEKGIAFATDDPNTVGAYIALSCYYHATASLTPVPFLDGLSTLGTFTVTGVGCFDDVHIVATHPALSGLTDSTLSNWSCSVHEAFDTWPPDFIVLAIAKGAGGTYTADDGTVGIPYILARGEDLVPINNDSVKWKQPPDETPAGMDIRIDRDQDIDRVVADDFECTTTGPITDVHFWGSWYRDPELRGYITRIQRLPTECGKPESPGRYIPSVGYGWVRSRIVLIKNSCPLGESIQIWRLNPRIPIAAHMISSKSVVHKHDDVHNTIPLVISAHF